jgi:hypothetical protein
MVGGSGRTESDKFIGCISLDSYLESVRRIYHTECEITTEELPIMSLLITQDSIDKEKYEAIKQGKVEAKDPIIVIQGIESRFLAVGHTRARAELDNDNRYITAHVLYPNTMRLEEELERQNLNLMDRCKTRKVDSINFYERPK